MKAIDLRNATFDGLRAGLDESRAAVMVAWREFGPGTTRAVALMAGIDLLTVRPRTTELGQCGLVLLIGRRGNEGVYAAASSDGWDLWRSMNLTGNGQQMLI